MLTRYLCIGLGVAALAALLLGPTAGGVLAAILMGFMAGNFACSLIHRLPRGKSILEHKPYCGACAHPLSEADLLPVIGVLLLKFRCRYCGVSIPTSHFWTEILIGALFAAAYLQFDFSQDFLLVCGIGVFLIILAFIQLNDRVLQPSIVVTVMVLGALYRTAHDGNVFDFLQGGLLGLLAGAIVWRKHIKPLNHIYTLPDGARLLAMAGFCAGTEGLWTVFALLVPLTLAGKLLRMPLAVPVAVAVMIPLLWPEVSILAILR